MTDLTSVQDPAAIDLDDRGLFFNRELSWLQFNSRVLELAEDPRTPLLERLKFCAIASSNLDEFFMVRVAGLHDQIDAGIETPLQDGRTPSEHGIRIVGIGDVSQEERDALDERFRRQIFPVLTPLAVGLGRPFPYIS